MEKPVCESVIEKLYKVFKISNSIMGDIAGCFQVYNKYEGKISKKEFLDILKNIKDCRGNKPDNLEYILDKFENDEEFNNFREKHRENIIEYMEATNKDAVSDGLKYMVGIKENAVDDSWNFGDNLEDFDFEK